MNKYAKMVEKIRAVIQLQLDKETAIIVFSKRVADALKRFDGLKVTRRMATALQKAIPEHAVFYNDDYDQPKIIINKVEGSEHYPTKEEDREIFYLGGGKASYLDHNFNYDDFVGNRMARNFGAAEARCEKRKAMLKPNAITWLMKTAKILVDFQEAADAFEGIEDSIEIPDRCYLLDLVTFELKKVRR